MCISSNSIIIKVSSGCCLFEGWNFKFAGVVPEYFSARRKYLGKQPTPSVFLVHYRVLRPEKERVFPRRMPVDIYQEQQLLPILLLQLCHVVDYAVYLRKNKLPVFSVEPIQIFPSNSSSGVAQNNSIWIKHRHNLEYYFISNPLCLWALVNQLFQKSVDDMASGRFGRMHSANNRDRIGFIRCSFSVRGCDSKKGNFKSTQGMTKFTEM